MSESRSHKTASNRIAKKYNTKYNSGKGVDVVSPKIVVEVETDKTVSSGLRQLQGHKKRAYIAGTNQAAVNKALAATKGKTIGVMNNRGEIVKRSTRGK